MNIFDTIQSARVDVDPMPLADRRRIREELFGTGQHDAARTISERSESGAVISTAPHGLRRPVRRDTRRRGISLLKTAAGLAVLGAIGAVAWSMLSDDAADDAVVESTSAPTSSVVPTATPTTIEPPTERTGVSREEPLVLPATQLTASELTIAPATSGIGTALLRAPDGSIVWLGEFDGVAESLSGADVRQVGALTVEAAAQPIAVSYRVDVPCGVVLMNDAPGALPYRPEIEALLNSMSVDASATIDVSLPDGWSVIDVGGSAASFIAEYEVPFFTTTAPVRLTQAPDGSLSQLAFGGRQLAPTTFLGEAAFIDTAPPTPETVSVYWRDADTVFNVSTDQLTLADLETFVSGLEPATIDTWSTRFNLPVPNPAPLVADCSPQPNLGSTLDP